MLSKKAVKIKMAKEDLAVEICSYLEWMTKKHRR